MKDKFPVTINNETMNLSERRIGRLSSLLLTPTHESAADVQSCSPRTMASELYGSEKDSLTGFLEGFHVPSLHGLRSTLLLEDPAYRAEVREYGAQICSPTAKLSAVKNRVFPWFFTSLSVDEIARELGLGEKAIHSHQNCAWTKIRSTSFHEVTLANGKTKGVPPEGGRFHLCAALLHLGAPPLLKDDTVFTPKEYLEWCRSQSR